MFELHEPPQAVKVTSPSVTHWSSVNNCWLTVIGLQLPSSFGGLSTVKDVCQLSARNGDGNDTTIQSVTKALTTDWTAVSLIVLQLLRLKIT